jgi:hypothetical protein
MLLLNVVSVLCLCFLILGLRPQESWWLRYLGVVIWLGLFGVSYMFSKRVTENAQPPQRLIWPPYVIATFLSTFSLVAMVVGKM